MPTLYDHNGNPMQERQAPRTRPRTGASGYYEAANYLSRARSNQHYWGVSDFNSTASKGIRDILMSQARHLAINSGEIRGLLRTMGVFSVGTGLRPQSQVENENIAKEYDEYFDWWAQSADNFSNASFWEIQRIVCNAIDRDGDIGIAWVKGGKLQLFESQQIADNGKLQNVFDGVEYDASGRTIAYRTTVSDRLTQSQVERRHLASLFALVFSPERVGQSRGVSALSHGINDAIDFSELMGFAKLGLKQREAIGFVIQNEDGVADPLSDPTATFRGDAFGISGEEKPAPTEEDLQFNFDLIKPGCVPRLRPNEKVEMLADSRPSNSFAEFTDTLLARISAGMGIPLEIVWPSKRSPTGPAMRSILARAQTTFDTRANLIEDLLCRKVWGWVISQGILDGTLKDTQGWQDAKWSRPPKLSIDAGRDAQASIAELLAGTTTLEGDAELRGQNWQAIRKQREVEADDLITRAKILAEKHDIDLKTAMGLLTDTKAAIASFNEGQEETQEEPTE